MIFRKAKTNFLFQICYWYLREKKVYLEKKKQPSQKPVNTEMWEVEIYHNL